jgi:hypothetical protein
MCRENIDLVLDRSRPFGPGTLDEWAELWHPGTRVTVPEEQPEFLLTQLKES